ncbi:MAG: DEAD/DEAH box helicase, partial [Desulfobacterales bacterium]
MHLSELEKWGIPLRIIKQWQKRQGESLLPVQSRAVRKGLIGRQGNGFKYEPVQMIISAPTSSGKSFCAELAAAKALAARQKTVMLFPLKSLAEQKYELFQKTYGGLGIKCLIVTGDYPENDSKFLKGDYQIAIVIYEKFDLLLTSSLDALKSIGLVVVDEIQTVTEPVRGAVLERLLTKIAASGYNPSLVGLSAVIGDDADFAGQLAGWLGAALVEETVRPVELIRGVAAEGSFRYRLFNDGLDGSEPFVTMKAGEEKTFDSFVTQIKNSSGSTLVFLKSRMETVDCAFKLAASINWPEAKKALEKLDGEEPSFLIRSLCQALSRGIAFHNSDLTSYQRNVIEQAFIDKEVKVIFSTTTLAMGVNLSADTVYLETVKYVSGKYGTRPALVPVSRAEFDNMTGRAGRLEAGDSKNKTGRAIVLADSEFDRDILWENYIAGDKPETMESAFKTMPLEDWLLNMIVTGLVNNSSGEALVELFRHTLYTVSGNEIDPSDFEKPLELLSTEGLITVDDITGQAMATSIARAAARTGLSAAETVHYRRKLEDKYPETSFGWIALALSGSDWNLPPAILSRYELGQNAPLKMLYQNFDHLIDEAKYLFSNNHSQYHREPLSYRQAASLKALLLLEQWRELVPVQKLEERFQMHLGQIMTLGET